MARFSQQMLQGLLNPAYQQQLSQVGQSVGQMPAVMSMQQRRKASQAEIQRLLQENRNNPTKLQQLAQQYRAQGNEDAAAAFTSAATQATNTISAGKAQGLQEGLSVITRAAERDIPLEQLKAASDFVIRAGGTNAQIREAYEAGKPEKKDYNFTEETVEINGKPVRVQIATSKTDPSDIKGTIIGTALPKEGTAGKATLTQQLKDAGVPEVDLTTLEGAKQARRDIISITGNASLANAVGNIIEDLTPLSVKEGLDIVRSTNPEFVEAENLRQQISRFTTLADLSSQDIAGLSALMERTLTATTENDIKAVSELERFRKAKDLPQRIKDFVLEVSTGKLSKETIDEYSTLAAAFDELAEMRMSRALDAMIVNGSPKESDAAQRAKNQILGESKARIIN